MSLAFTSSKISQVLVQPTELNHKFLIHKLSQEYINSNKCDVIYVIR